MLLLLALPVGFGVLSWLVTGGFSHMVLSPTTTPSPIARTSPSPSPILSDGLNGVTCVSASDCWAVGSSGNSDNVQPLIEHYAGSSWAIVSTPNAIPGGLNGVTCANAGDCWAVGSLPAPGPGNSTQALIEHYVGSSWDIVSTPSPGQLKHAEPLGHQQPQPQPRRLVRGDL